MVRQVLGHSETVGRVVLVVEDANHPDNRPGKLQQAPPNERSYDNLAVVSGPPTSRLEAPRNNNV